MKRMACRARDEGMGMAPHEQRRACHGTTTPSPAQRSSQLAACMGCYRREPSCQLLRTTGVGSRNHVPVEAQGFWECSARSASPGP